MYSPGIPNEEAIDGQICLGDAEALEWVWQKLVRFIDEVRPDQLKWDYNRFMICNRPGHGHPLDGGNFAHVQGLYTLLRRLRAQYPSLIIENVSGGGRRLDLAMARMTDMGWMDDRTGPARHVRNNLEGLTRIFPSSYLFSYVVTREDEPFGPKGDMLMYGRSRMLGTYGVSMDFDRIDDVGFTIMKQQVGLSAKLREVQADAVTIMLSPVAIQEPSWELVEQLSVSSGRALLFAFQSGPGGATLARLQRLGANELYEVRSVDTGLLGRFTGRDLMDDGLYIEPSPYSSSQVFTIDPIGIR
jgi:alpha-galactosidase